MLIFYNDALQLDPLSANHLVTEKSPYVERYRLRTYEKVQYGLPIIEP